MTKVTFHQHNKNVENSTMHTMIQNVYEKEIETLLNSSNSVITRQTEALMHAQEGEAWKAKYGSSSRSILKRRRKV